jgi:hypothetical protein
MPRLGELGKIGDRMAGIGPLASSPLLAREASSVTRLDLLVFLKLADLVCEGYSNPARRDIAILLEETARARLSGQLDTTPDYAYFEESPLAFTVTDLCAGLDNLEPEFRRAALFALETGISPDKVMILEPARVRQLTLSPLAQAIAQATPRHLKLNYLFWQFLPGGQAAPLFGFKELLSDAFDGHSFEELLANYRRMVWVDMEAELDDFLLQASF